MKKESISKISLLSASLLVASAPAINANIPAMAAAFPKIPLSMVEMLTTISSMFLMISVLTSSFIANKIGYKQTIVLGLSIVAFSGVIPAFVSEFYIILISRAMLGFGIGLFNSLLVSMISYFYEGDERSSLFGIQSACEGLGGMSITFLAGQLLIINWQAPFYAYFIAIPVVISFLLFVPKVDTKDMLQRIGISSKIETSDKKGSYVPVVGYTCLMFVVAVLYMTMGIKVSTLMTSEGYASASDASLVIICLSVGSMLSGMLFGKILNIMKSYTLTLGFSIMAFAMILIGQATSGAVVMVGGFCIGAAYRLVFPYLIHKINVSQAPDKSIATSLFLAGANLGCFLAPYGALVLDHMAGGSNLRGIFYVGGFGFIILALGSGILSVIIKRIYVQAKPVAE